MLPYEDSGSRQKKQDKKNLRESVSHSREDCISIHIRYQKIREVEGRVGLVLVVILVEESSKYLSSL
ncbi:hypothetical protein CSUI_004888 [Cystoisospora suis]|uniref:Uncharacterized protein n=1 Tax=Cystoisospora suis TaxID=483139 RepID=A0A2C6KZK1_9APIC|nr:hypothetical protein CSUI_004888 [Cystoisospora suis]